MASAAMILAFLLICTRVQAQEGTPLPAPAPSSTPLPEPAPVCIASDSAGDFSVGTLWRIEREGKLRGHLLGTLHIGLPEMLNVPRVVDLHVKEARALVVEVAPQEGEDLQLQEMRNLPSGVHIESYLDPKTVKLYRKLALERGFKLSDLQNLRPLTVATLIQFAEYLPLRALDDSLVDLAKEQGLPVLGLEPLADQIRASTCLDIEEEAVLMKETLAQGKNFRRIGEHMLTLYQKGKIGELLEYSLNVIPLSKQAKRYEERDKTCLIDQRNVRMSQRLVKLLNDNAPIFVAVGAFHIVGSDGLLAKLAREGFNVCRARD